MGVGPMANAGVDRLAEVGGAGADLGVLGEVSQGRDEHRSDEHEHDGDGGDFPQPRDRQEPPPADLLLVDKLLRATGAVDPSHGSGRQVGSRLGDGQEL